MNPEKPPFEAPFGMIPALRLSIVPRWNIVKMARTQSVAEHSFATAVIVRVLAGWKGLTEDRINMLIRDAIFHDYDEIYTGDTPSPMKPRNEFANPLIKLADVIEAHRFAHANCVDTNRVKEWLLGGLFRKIVDRTEECGLNMDEVYELIKE